MNISEKAKNLGRAAHKEGEPISAEDKAEADMSPVIAYTDGGCWPNPGGPGGWGVMIKGLEMQTVEMVGGERESTNNKMEMQAAIEALRRIGPTTRPVTLYTDSEYLKRGASEWLAGWKRRNWKTAGKKPVKNLDRWQQIDELMKAMPNLTWKWVRGHSGNPGNERADALATLGKEMVAAETA